MIRRAALILTLGTALTGGVVTAVHAAGNTTPTPLVTRVTSDQTADTDANAPCATNASTGEQTGDCNSTQDVNSGPDTPEAADTGAEAGD